MIEQPIFRSTGQALDVAYLILTQPPTSKSPTQAVIDDLLEMAGVRKEREHTTATVNFGGLSPLEVRAQCSMITAAVRDHLAVAERRAVEARYAYDERKAEGIRFLRDWCAPHWTIESPTARMAIMWHVHMTESQASHNNCTVRAIEGEHGIPKSTVHDQVAKIRKVVSSLRERGVWQLDWRFREQGVVGDHDA